MHVIARKRWKVFIFVDYSASGVEVYWPYIVAFTAQLVLEAVDIPPPKENPRWIIIQRVGIGTDIEFGGMYCDSAWL
jgi:hypothetical protein